MVVALLAVSLLACVCASGGAALLSLAAGYCAVAKRDGKQPAKAKAEP
jgi:hypothetical protein